MRYNLSEISQLIEDRRTVLPEQFSERKVHREIIENLLNAARWAPTHKLTQPWRFTVFMGRGLSVFGQFHADTYKRITDPVKFSEIKFEKLKNRPLLASAVIAVAMHRDSENRLPEIEEIAAVSAAVQNMSLLAAAYGLGFYWGTGGMTYTDEMRSFLGHDVGDKVLGLIYLGYPEGNWPRKTPRKPIEYFTQWVED
jgi:nitroreductase